ncbi:MAG: leucine-rich repeat protein, partial [Clostridia bacterium]|nr:leucine-rich repeat protein [Clostridia bacterium]
LSNELNLNKLKRINMHCFAGNSSIEKITIGSDLSYLGSSCFSDMYRLKEITLTSNPSNLTFDGLLNTYFVNKNIKIFVPDEYYGIYVSKFSDDCYDNNWSSLLYKESERNSVVDKYTFTDITGYTQATYTSKYDSNKIFTFKDGNFTSENENISNINYVVYSSLTNDDSSSFGICLTYFNSSENCYEYCYISDIDYNISDIIVDTGDGGYSDELL